MTTPTDDPAALIDRLREILVASVMDRPPAAPIEPDDDLIAKGHIASLQMLDLVEALEKEFSIRIPHYEVAPENFETLRRMADYIAKKSGG
ncbi:MAG: acyl carrier protein [Deltaproteobacteria bacterium]|nr:acyl carrier protein [Deltaproteobacteria bacterium]MCB9490169.1 acyl carrier protein [Deltaproteobacteria bacterium]